MRPDAAAPPLTPAARRTVAVLAWFAAAIYAAVTVGTAAAVSRIGATGVVLAVCGAVGTLVCVLAALAISRPRSPNVLLRAVPVRMALVLLVGGVLAVVVVALVADESLGVLLPVLIIGVGALALSLAAKSVQSRAGAGG